MQETGKGVKFQKAYLDYKKAHPDSGLEKPNAGLVGMGAATVKGIEPKQIILNFNGKFIELNNTYKNTQESASDIERTVTQSVLNGINAGEMLMPR